MAGLDPALVDQLSDSELDAALVRDLLMEVAVIADHSLVAAPTVPEG